MHYFTFMTSIETPVENLCSRTGVSNSKWLAGRMEIKKVVLCVKNQFIWKTSKMTYVSLKIFIFFWCSRAALNPLAGRVFETPALEEFTIVTLNGLSPHGLNHFGLNEYSLDFYLEGILNLWNLKDHIIFNWKTQFILSRFVRFSSPRVRYGVAKVC